MAQRKITCSNTLCRFNTDDKRCTLDHIEVGYEGCESFKPDLCYYTNLVWNMLHNTNFICTFQLNLTDEKRVALYIVAKLWGLLIANDTSRGMIYFAGEEGTGPLKHEEIIERELNHDELERFCQMIEDDSIMSLFEKAEDAEEEESKQTTDNSYGYVSPQGDFILGDWGTHEQLADDIIKDRHMGDEYEEWSNSSEGGLSRDFLIQQKGYALIHDPMNFSYTVTHIKPLTKAQKEFLYSYFIDMGMKYDAELYVD